MYNEDIVKTLTCCVRFSLSLSLFVSRSMVALFGGSTSSQNMMHAVTRVNPPPLETRSASPQRIHGSQSVSMYPHNRSPFGRIVCEPIRAEHKRTNGDRRFKQTRNLISEPKKGDVASVIYPEEWIRRVTIAKMKHANFYYTFPFQ